MKTLLWVVAEIVLVFVLLSIPGNQFHTPSKWFGDFPIDKLIHVILFGSLALSFFVHFEKSRHPYLRTVRAKALVLIFCMLYGIGMEFYQKYFVPSRGFEISDMLADTIGALLAVPAITWLKHKINKA